MEQNACTPANIVVDEAMTIDQASEMSECNDTAGESEDFMYIENDDNMIYDEINGHDSFETSDIDDDLPAGYNSNSEVASNEEDNCLMI